MKVEIFHYDEVDSTNLKAKQLAEEGAAHGSLVIADGQLAGKGRRGRTWEASKGDNIFMSLLLRPDIPPAKAPMLTLVMAYSVACALRDKQGIDAKIKWPNDIVLNRKKICGILTEMNMSGGAINHVVIGVGINLNMKEFPEELKEKATSIYIEEGRAFDRMEVIENIVECFEEQYEKFVSAGDLSEIFEEYNQILVNADSEVRVLEPGHEYTAHALGINRTGELLVEKEDGKREEVFAGEVSVRGIYGYV